MNLNNAILVDNVENLKKFIDYCKSQITTSELDQLRPLLGFNLDYDLSQVKTHSEVDLTKSVIVDNKYNLLAFIKHFTHKLSTIQLDELRSQCGFNLIPFQKVI